MRPEKIYLRCCACGKRKITHYAGAGQFFCSFCVKAVKGNYPKPNSRDRRDVFRAMRGEYDE